MNASRIAGPQLLWSLLSLSIILSGQTDAQPGAIYGRITDGETGLPLAGANVMIEDLGLGAASAADGAYRFSSIAPGRYVISASVIGYRVAKRKITLPASATVDFKLQPMVLPGQQIVVTGDRARRRETPIAFSDIPRAEISARATAQDVPMLLETVPGVYSYSDAGNGIGYTYLKIRGFDQRRVAVSINGIPLNDPEDHQVYWVDMPNLLANVADIQVQRGVGSSIYGRNAFGGSVNLVTLGFPAERRLGVAVGRGSYNTRTWNLDFHSGLVDNTYAFYARFSRIVTDGYRHASWTDMWSYFLSASRYTQNSTLTLNVYGGPERSHAAWDASPESVLAGDHRHNPYAFYANETDNFNQPHYELHYQWRPTEGITLSQAFYYIRGEGFFEQRKFLQQLTDYGFMAIPTTDPGLYGSDSLRYYATTDSDGDGVDDALRLSDGRYRLLRTDLVRERWVLKDQIGWSPNLSWEREWGTLTFGSELSWFASNHFGKVLGGSLLPASWDPEASYYKYAGNKWWVAPYVHLLYRPGPVWSLFAELQLQYKQFRFLQGEAGGFSGALRNGYDLTYTFINPRLGANLNLTPRLNLFGYLGRASREPADSELYDLWQGPDDLGVQPLFASVDTVRIGGEIDHLQWSGPSTQPEQLTDIELGAGYAADRFSASATFYVMLFDNEIVPFGGVNDEGQPITGNAGRTLHQGLELEGQIDMARGLSLGGNLSLSRNIYLRFDYHDYSGETFDFSGNPIPLFPGLLANLWGRFSSEKLRITAAVRSVGSQQLDNTGDPARIVDPYTIANLNLAWTLGGLELRLAVNNLLDREYETSGYWADWAGERYLYPAAGLVAVATLTVAL